MARRRLDRSDFRSLRAAKLQFAEIAQSVPRAWISATYPPGNCTIGVAMVDGAWTGKHACAGHLRCDQRVRQFLDRVAGQLMLAWTSEWALALRRIIRLGGRGQCRGSRDRRIDGANARYLSAPGGGPLTWFAISRQVSNST